MIRFFDAFAGIGGARKGLENTKSFKCMGYCEIDKFTVQSYRAIYDTGDEEYYENIRTIDTEKLGDFDLLVGGFPCQPFSLAGKRKSFEDERGNLFFELARLLEAKRPKYFIFENVPGILSAEKGTAFAKILDTLCELGYSVAWRVLNSADFGVPQSRKRVFIVGYLGEKCPTEVLAFGGQHNANNKFARENLRQIIGGSQGSRVYSANGLATTQCSGAGGMGGKTGLYLIDMNPPPNLTDIARCITGRQNSGVSNRKGEHSGVLIEDAPRAIINPFKKKVYQNGRRIKEPDEPMFTVTVTDRHGIVHKGRIRRLMPIECWRLQGFSNDDFLKATAIGMSDSQLYKQAGNAITVNVMEAIGRKLIEFDQQESEVRV